MDVKIFGRSRWLALPALLLALGAGAAFSGEVLIKTENSSTPVDLQASDLGAAVVAANQSGENGSTMQHEVDAVFDIQGSQTASGIASGAAWFLHGNGDPAPLDPTLLGANAGFHNVVIAGNGHTLSVTDGSAPVLEVINSAGTIGIENLTITGGMLTTKAINGGSGGAGAFLGATNRYDPANYGVNATAINLTKVAVIGNAVDIQETAAAAGTSISGGGLFVDGSDYSTMASTGTATFDQVALRDNTLNFAVHTANDSSAIGGGARFKLVDNLLYTNSVVQNNSVVIANGIQAHGGGVAYEGDNAKGEFRSVDFVNNRVEVSGAGFSGGNWANAYGGGFYGLSMKTVGTTEMIFSGAAATFLTFSGNQAVANGATPGEQVRAKGGAAYLSGSIDATFANVHFTGNQATSDGEAAFGGAVAREYYGTGGQTSGSLKFSETWFDGNSANAHGKALGGALYTRDGGNTLDDVIFTGNTASAVNAAGYAEGGAIFLNAGRMTLTNAILYGNSAAAVTGERAKGGAIFVNTDRFEAAGASETGDAGLSLVAAAGEETIIAGNVAGDGKSHGIYFGNSSFGSGAGYVNADFSVGGAGDVVLLDPVVVEMDKGASQAFTMNKNGAGVLAWGGKNLFNADGGSAINLNSGYTVFADDFSAAAENGSNLAVSLGTTGATFTANRDANQALFDFSNGTGAVNGEIGLSINRDRTFFGFERNYKLAEQLDATGGLVAGDYVVGIFEAGGNTWATTRYNSQYYWEASKALANGKAAAGWAGNSAVEQLMNQDWLSDEEARAIGFNLDSAAPGFILTMGRVGMAGVESVARTAKTYGLAAWGGDNTPRFHAAAGSDRALAALPDGAFPHTGLRFWAGYVGDFDRQDTHGGYYGYKSDRNGFVAGLNYDFSEVATIGFYGGYTHTKTNARGLNAEVKSDAGHFGLFGAFAPVASLPNLSFNADIGYTFTDNDSERFLGGRRASGSFDQDIFTIGLEAAYRFSFFNSLSVTPYASARYGHVSQDALNETGFTAAHVGKVSDSSFHTKLGVGVGYDFRFFGGVITPTVNVAWRHDYGKRQYRANAHYLGVANPVVFKQRSVRADRNTMDLGVALRAAKQFAGSKQLGLNVGYNLNVGRHRDDHSVYAGLDFSF